jgi:hypothetical protein
VAGGAALLLVGIGVLVVPTTTRVWGARNISLTFPQQVAGMTLDTSAQSAETTGYLSDAVRSGTSLSNPTAAAYDVGGDRTHSILLFGGTGSIYRPGHELSRILGLLDDTDSITDLHPVAPGPLGGEMKCGISVDAGDLDDPDIPICGWADHGSAVAALFPGRTVAEAAELFRKFREAIEQR